jgi:hypothetical protein
VAPGISRILDRIAIGLSSLCLLHCLATPLLFLLLPAVSLSLLLPDTFHLWMLAAAIPTSLAALGSGHRRHRQFCPAILASGGLALLGVGAFFVSTAILEIWATVAGALLLSFAHVCNARLSRIAQA